MKETHHQMHTSVNVACRKLHIWVRVSYQQMPPLPVDVCIYQDELAKITWDIAFLHHLVMNQMVG